jgi:hypothetical protein
MTSGDEVLMRSSSMNFGAFLAQKPNAEARS